MTRRLGVRLVGALLALASSSACGSAPAPVTHEQTRAGPAADSAVPLVDPSLPQIPGPPPPTSKVPAPRGRLAGKVIVLDPGHNGGSAAHPELISRLVDAYTQLKPCNTTGTQTDGGYSEHAFTWDVANRLAKLLRAAGATVILTRSSDNGVGPCITERAAIANRNHATVALSIHGDGGPAAGHGFHVMEPALIAGAPSTAIVDPSHRLAVAVRDQLATVLSPATYIGQDGINTRSDMAGLNLSRVPVVMVECGNMRNAGDARLMRDPAGRQRLAAALAVGLTAFVT